MPMISQQDSMPPSSNEFHYSGIKKHRELLWVNNTMILSQSGMKENSSNIQMQQNVWLLLIATFYREVFEEWKGLCHRWWRQFAFTFYTWLESQCQMVCEGPFS